MNNELLHKIPWLPLVFLWLAYAWLGWYLSAHDIAWLVGAFVAALVLAIAWRTIAWLERLIRFGSRALTVVLFLGASIALIATWSIFVTFIVLPLTTTLLAEMEFRFAGFGKRDTFLVLSAIAGCGLVIGEVIDLLIIPSSRY
ncbi:MULTISPECIES: hypothetical protein [Nostocales]|uniref:DUF4175 domain-containing protein n=3 Tax=Nostocales TaxID=1161 RepID=A0A0C1R7X0_9CYAN|nr:hypothetical protein [Tolypothrix bouteillei]KAF3884766.1 DUF4175 domain-containing protein [Tolypothrix bouteillei VB521301]